MYLLEKALQLAVIKIEEDNERYPEADESEEYVIFNPQLTYLEETRQGFWEGCLSVPGLRGLVFRPRKIHVDYFDENAKIKPLFWKIFLQPSFNMN